MSGEWAAMCDTGTGAALWLIAWALFADGEPAHFVISHRVIAEPAWAGARSGGVAEDHQLVPQSGVCRGPIRLCDKAVTSNPSVHPVSSSARKRWTNCTAMAPSPTALATRLIEECRTSPTAKDPGTLVSK
jgi:hypothetical protein